MKSPSALDRLAMGLISILVVLIALVILIGRQAGIRVTASLPQGGLIGPLEVIRLTFSEPVDPNMAESLFSIRPEVEGSFHWADARTLHFTPSRPFELATAYKLTLRSGVLTQDQRKLKSDRGWDLSVRAPLISFLKTQNDQSSIWSVDLNNHPPVQLTDSSIKVIGFDSSRDGEFIVFYSVNAQGGIDLWRVSRAGGDAAVLLDCGHDRCTAPSISPDGTRVAYSREVAGPGPDLPYGSPRVWLLDVPSGKNSPVYADQQVLGYNPAWSPDGTQLASYDGIADQVRLLDISGGGQSVFSSNTGGPVTWSPDGKKFLFTDVVQSESGLRTRVRMADLALHVTSTLIGDKDEVDLAYYSLAWSPLDESVLLGMRSSSEDPAQVFWLFDPGHLDGIIIADEPDTAYNSPSWDVWGGALVFQQFKLRGPYKPEIGIWKPGFRAPLVVVEGLMPHWMP